MGKALRAVGCKMLVHLLDWLEVCQKKTTFTFPLESDSDVGFRGLGLGCSGERQSGSATASHIKGNLCPT